MNYSKILKNFIILLLALFVLCSAVVVVFDPFFHYHKPVLGLKAVLSDKEYQCIGSLSNLEYNSVVVGSSVCENYNNTWFDEAFDAKTIKAVRSYGGTADLNYLLQAAFENHDIKNVFYNIDPGNLANEPYISFEETGCPMYLYDDNPVNDIQYLLNKDVLLEKIPYMITKSYIGDYDEGTSFNWGQWKVFSTEETLSHYYRAEQVNPMNSEDIYEEACDKNIAIIENIVKQHPDTQFYFFYPPYSFLWFDNIRNSGDTEAYLYNMKRCANVLIKYDNVRFYNFMNEEEIVGNLDNYMDALHFHPDINYYIVQKLLEDDKCVTKDNIDEIFSDMNIYAYDTVDELITKYEPMMQQ